MDVHRGGQAFEAQEVATVEIVREIQPTVSGATGLAADSTGIKHEGNRDVLISAALLEKAQNVFLEAAKDSSAGDEGVTVELFDVTAAAVDASLAITGADQRARSADVLGSLTAGNDYRVRWNVTTASATTGATFDADGAVLVIERELT